MFCCIHSYIATCEKHGITVFDALESLFMHNTYIKFIQGVIDKMPILE
ncbi:hypothetical protein SAMN02583745_02948 [Thorsellia anophelis DSM 18579]|uniref:Uncharacterized protein n=1 Tax=Thorsellia anophelis DSM 18579 TaxID=1123402 RepID=A0A1I0G2K7_9GAMM|nr:hypothetical protein SAMN02583745_02948 [Thorsellia anophelis DSM 18579]